jgi:hypothetical protein
MKANCLDIGLIQAFLDGETAPAVSLEIADHVSGCDACSGMLAEAEEQSAVVFPLLEREFNTLVPTQRLWARINEEITIEKRNTPLWKKLWTAVAIQLHNPSITVAASIVVILGIFAAFWNGDATEMRSEQLASSGSSAVPAGLPVSAPSRPESSVPAADPELAADLAPARVPSARQPQFVVQRADLRLPPRRSTASSTDAAVASVPAYLPGEESYVKTIASLTETVAVQKDEVMAPSERVAYERDMAVVNDSIKKIRAEVRKNPRNESARQVLYSSYQNKIDLLNSVTQKGELIASLR